MSNTIIINEAGTVLIPVLADGLPVVIPSDATVTAQLFDIATLAPLFTPVITCLSTDVGSDWTSGIVQISFDASQTANVATPAAMLAISINSKPYRFRIDVESSIAAYTKSALFIKDFAITEIRQDRLFALAQSIEPGVTISDDYIWNKLLAAESDISHTLRVELQATAFFPKTPTDDQVAGLNGMPWKIDPAYDYDPAMFQGDNWSFIAVRNIPLISITSLNYNYPSENEFDYNIPLEWLKFDAKFGQIRIVPTSNITLAMLGGFMIQLIGAGRNIPHILSLTYVAGLADARTDYPELVDVILKSAALKIIQDAFVPQSGSISADGLSQSMSIDIDKYAGMIDSILNGPKGSNGGLMTKIHGIRSLVLS